MKLLASAIAIALFSAPDTARQTFDSAMQSTERRRLPAAEAGFNKILASDPAMQAHLPNLGVLYLPNPSLRKSHPQVYQRALRVSPQLLKIQLDLASPI